MKKTIKEKACEHIHKFYYEKTHPQFAKVYSSRFSNDFSQADLEYCVKCLYEFYLGKKLDFNNVRSFNEKLNWLKCFYHDENMTVCADKVTAPAYFKSNTGLDDTYIVKNIGIYSNAEEIHFASLPERFVLKSNWGSGKQIVVLNKKKVDFEKIKGEMSTWCNIKSNHYYYGFEYGYNNIEPKIVCEEFVTFDYKIEFFCFNGKPVYFWTVFNDKTDEVCADFYDAATLKKIKMKHGYPSSGTTIKIPDEYNQMMDIAKNISKGFPFVRIDFFKTPRGFKFSEMTFYHWCGLKPFEPANMDMEFGKNIVLPEKLI